jgi:fructokinase
MRQFLGLDIGGTKIAGASFDEKGAELAHLDVPTPDSYDALLDACRVLVGKLEVKERALTVGACAPYAADVCANIPYLAGKKVRQDLEKLLGRPIPFGNDANCAALAESVEGAGRGHRALFGLIIGTGVGGGFILDGKIIAGANGLCGEIGHLPLPFYEESDGERVSCGCGQKGCIEQFVAGTGLSRLYRAQTGQQADAKQIGAMANEGNAEARAVLDTYYTLVAKAMVVVLHSFDPHIITVSGGLNALPGLYDEVPKRWGKYAVCKNPATKFVPASLGPRAGLRGAALLGMAR